jgi:ribosomal protein S18 acetylase RimI-like enzyme
VGARLEIRRAAEDDLDQLSQMRWEARAEGGEHNQRLSAEAFKATCTCILREWMRAGSHAFWIARADDLIVAHIAVHRVDLLPRPIRLHDRFGVITENYTRPQFRNRGVGSRLLRHVVAWAREEDYELLIVYPSERARSLYARAGFMDDSEVMELVLREYASPSWIEPPG